MGAAGIGGRRRGERIEVSARDGTGQQGSELAVNGGFGPRTDGAVKAFQNAKGLVVDDIVGPQT